MLIWVLIDVAWLSCRGRRVGLVNNAVIYFKLIVHQTRSILTLLTFRSLSETFIGVSDRDRNVNKAKLTNFNLKRSPTRWIMFIDSELFCRELPVVRQWRSRGLYSVSCGPVSATRTERSLRTLSWRQDHARRGSHRRGPVLLRLPRDDQVQYVLNYLKVAVYFSDNVNAIYWPFRPCFGCSLLLCNCLVYSLCTGV